VTSDRDRNWLVIVVAGHRNATASRRTVYTGFEGSRFLRWFWLSNAFVAPVIKLRRFRSHLTPGLFSPAVNAVKVNGSGVDCERHRLGFCIGLIAALIVSVVNIISVKIL